MADALLEGALASLQPVASFVVTRANAHVEWLTTPHGNLGFWEAASTLAVPWAVQFVMSWVGFGIYMVWDYRAWRAGRLEAEKLPSRHPVQESPVPPGPDGLVPILGGLFRVAPFWYSQLFMVPLILYNQLVVWPLTSLLVVWPQWQQNERSVSEWPGGIPGLLGSLVCLMLISDQMWYWSHRLMHVPWCWKHLHKMHHIAPQAALSATYVHPLEYVLFTLAMQLPFAVAGFPMWVHAIPTGWGMLTGSGAHSGYGGSFANGEKHGTGHHLYHSANFGLLMIADAIYGTHWAPGDPRPGYFELGVKDIETNFTAVWGVGVGATEHGQAESAPAPAAAGAGAGAPSKPKDE